MEHKIDPNVALALWNQGQSLGQIRAALAPTASKMAVQRAIRRAVKAGGAARPPVPAKGFRRAMRDKIPARIEKLKQLIAELEREYADVTTPD